MLYDYCNTWKLPINMSIRDNFVQTQSNLADRCLRVMYGPKLFRNIYALYAPKPSFVCTLFDKSVMLVLLYGSEIWGFHDAVDNGKVHLLFCKKLSHLEINTANYFIYSNLGRYSLDVNCKSRIARYWLKTIMGEHYTPVYNMYQIT